MTRIDESISWWARSSPTKMTTRTALSDDQVFDVAIVGGGFSGLWAAYYIKEKSPNTSVCIIEKEHVGFGASGRNGGWCVGSIKASDQALESMKKGSALEMAQILQDTVDEVGRVSERESIECDYKKGGVIYLATNDHQMRGLLSIVDRGKKLGLSAEDNQILSVIEARKRINISAIKGALYSPHCAVLNPFNLAAGLAQAVERKGVRIYERSRVLKLEPRRVVTENAIVRAETVVRATEAYTSELPQFRRAMIPLHSMMIVTEQIPENIWSEIGLSNREAFEDGRKILYYGQRTADNRIAIGGLTISYKYQSRIDSAYMNNNHAHAKLEKLLAELFPMAGRLRVEQRWGGVLGIPRDLMPSVGYEPTTGDAWLGGYVGEGVAASNLAGRSLADLLFEPSSTLANLPWVNHRSIDWEPEPLRWLGTTLVRSLMQVMDWAAARGLNRTAELTDRIVPF